MRYDSRSGMADLIRESGSGSVAVSSRRLATGLEFDAVRITNHLEWGDLTLDGVSVEVVVQPD